MRSELKSFQLLNIKGKYTGCCLGYKTLSVTKVTHARIKLEPETLPIFDSV